MFTNGQWVFAALFFIGFLILMFFSYRGDKRLHKKQYRGSLWVLVGFLVFIAILFFIKSYLKG